VTVLSLRDIEKLNCTIGDIYAAHQPDQFFSAVVPLLKDLLSSDIASYNEFEPGDRLVKMIASSHDHDEIFRKNEAAAKAYIPTHPCFNIFSPNKCTLLSDAVNTDAFKRTEVYNEYYRYLEVQSQIFSELPIQKGVRRFFAFGRGRPYFSERERFLLNLIKPHVIQAYRNSVELCRYKKKVALFDQGEDFPALRALGLTDREAVILAWAAKGKTNADIASILGISRRTVEKHFERIYEKLGVETKIAAVSTIVNAPPNLMPVIPGGEAP